MGSNAEKKSYSSQRNRFEDVKDWEINRLADALNKGYGDINETKKQLKKSSVKEEEHLNFVAKYMSEINSIVLERLQVSPEMRMFFENPENMSKSQKQKMEAYWQVPERREHRSLIMKDTIQNFFEAYGVDGQNEEFKELLDYAHSIKPNRIAQMKEFEKIHNEKQAYYDEMFAELDANGAKENSIKTMSELLEQNMDFEEVMEDVKEKFNVQEYKFKIDGEDIVIVSDIKEAFVELMKEQMALMPKSLANKYINFLLNNDKVTDSFILSFLLQQEIAKLPEDDRVMPKDESLKLNFMLENEFLSKNASDCIAAQQAMSDILVKYVPDKASDSVSDMFQLVNIFNNLPEEDKKFILQDVDMVKTKYNEYRKPLSDSEVRKISIQIYNMLRNYNPADSVIVQDGYFAGLNSVIYSLSCYLKNQKPLDFKNEITAYVKRYGGSLRVLMQEDAPQKLKMAKLEQLFYDYSLNYPVKFVDFMTRDKEGLNYIIQNSPYMLNGFEDAFNKKRLV